MGDITGIYTAAGTLLNNVMNWGGSVTFDPDPKTCSYTHFDLSEEQLGRTSRYNCWGFTFLPRRYWINSEIDVDNILKDNCAPVNDGSIKKGDVIRYRDDQGRTTHTGRVWQVDNAGHAVKIRSKWGGWAEYIHDPLDVPKSYGTNLAYFRQVAPLRGVADLWIKDSSGDNGNQFADTPWWTSPDIKVDVPPYDGIPDVNPAFNLKNRIWTVLRNRGDKKIENVNVRYYWADPAAGLPPQSWNLIQGTPAHPNPVGPLSIPANSSIDAPYVEWIPQASTAHQCLIAIAYINDDPTDSSNPDPIVYSFEVPWDNSIGQRNVQVIHLNKGSNTKFSIKSGNIWNGEAYKGSIKAVLTNTLGMQISPLLGGGAQPEITIAMNKEKKFAMIPWSEYFQVESLRLPSAMTKVAEPKSAIVESMTSKPLSQYDLSLESSASKATISELAVAEIVEQGTFERESTLKAPIQMVSKVDYLGPVMYAQVEKPVSALSVHDLIFTAAKPHELEIEIKAPEGAREGDVYYLHITQNAFGEVLGGYTVAIEIV